LQGLRDRDYSAAWAEHRKWRAFSLLGFFVFFALAIELASLEVSQIYFWGLLAVPLALWVWINGKTSEFLCPRCKQIFYKRQVGGVGYNIFARKCQNCGMRFGQRREVE
jgi:hypothetical protein